MRPIARAIAAASICIIAPLCNATKTPDCTGPERWPASTAYAQLKNAGVLSPETVEFDRVTSVRVASERIQPDLWRQVHRVRFPLNSGRVVQVLTVSDASSKECSMGEVQIYVLSLHLINK